VAGHDLLRPLELDDTERRVEAVLLETDVVVLAEV
jgi:hypothetical protein